MRDTEKRGICEIIKEVERKIEIGWVREIKKERKSGGTIRRIGGRAEERREDALETNCTESRSKNRNSTTFL